MEDYNTKYVIGFSGVMYTLWLFNKYDKYNELIYIKNISKSLDKAKSYCESNNLEYTVDESLHGKTYKSGSRDISDIPDDRLYFFKESGLISECTSTWHLWSAYRNKDDSKARRDNCRARLIELDDIKYIDGKEVASVDYEYMLKQNELEQEYRDQVIDYFYEPKQRVNLLLTYKSYSYYDTMYGRIYIQKFMDSDNRVFYYKGKNTIDADNGRMPERNTKFNIKATIKHNEYNGSRQTLIQRIKVIS